MPDQETQTADSQARITLPAAFADAKVIVEMLSPSEIRIRIVGAPSDELSALPENRSTILSDRDRDRFLEILASPPEANAALRDAMKPREG